VPDVPPSIPRPTAADPVRIRLAEEADLRAVGDITVRAYVDGGYVDEQDGYASQLRAAEDRRRRAEMWVATGLGTCARRVPDRVPHRRTSHAVSQSELAMTAGIV
jgi:hypothetical protein